MDNQRLGMGSKELKNLTKILEIIFKLTFFKYFKTQTIFLKIFIKHNLIFFNNK
jgi:hypothetical protein